MVKNQSPATVNHGKFVISRALGLASNSVDRLAEYVVQDVLGSRMADVAQDIPEDLPHLDEERTELRYHRDKLWAEPQMWIEMAAGGVGSAAYLASSISNSTTGKIVGLIHGVAVKGLPLLFHLGRPERVPLVFAKPTTSWIARGSWAFALFAGGGTISILPMFPRNVRLVGETLANASAPVLMIYEGYFLNDSRVVHSWRSRQIPVMFAASSACAGIGLAGALRTPRIWHRPALLASAALSLASSISYLSDLEKGSSAAQMSAYELKEGDQSTRYRSFQIAGTAFPAVLAILPVKSAQLRSLGAVLAAYGVLANRRAILQAGVRAPVYEIGELS